MRPIVAFQGESGAFSEKAIEFLVEGPVKLLSCNTFDATTGAVVQGIADLAVIPVENLIAGPVHAALDALAAAPELEQIGEHQLPVRHALLGLPGATIGDIREALSHEMALKQCRRFFAEHHPPHLGHERGHIRHEDALLFRIAEEMIDTATQRELYGEFKRAEEEFGASAVKHYENLMTELEEKWAI